MSKANSLHVFTHTTTTKCWIVCVVENDKIGKGERCQGIGNKISQRTEKDMKSRLSSELQE